MPYLALAVIHVKRGRLAWLLFTCISANSLYGISPLTIFWLCVLMLLIGHCHKISEFPRQYYDIPFWELKFSRYLT